MSLSFVGRGSDMGTSAPCDILKFYIYTDGTHTHTHTHAPPQRGRLNENESEMTMTMKMKWKILSRDAKRGTQEKRERENTNTTHLARSGQTLKRQGKRKAEADGQRNKTSGGGGRQKRLNQPNAAKTYTNLSTQRAKPTWREENARTHEIKDPWGTS